MTTFHVGDEVELWFPVLGFPALPGTFAKVVGVGTSHSGDELLNIEWSKEIEDDIDLSGDPTLRILADGVWLASRFQPSLGMAARERLSAGFPIGLEVELAGPMPGMEEGERGRIAGYVGKYVRVQWYAEHKGYSFGWDPSVLKLVGKGPAAPDPAYCSCGSSNVVRNVADGKPFLYCRGCGKERKP
jgi:hypothetical protein